MQIQVFGHTCRSGPTCVIATLLSLSQYRLMRHGHTPQAVSGTLCATYLAPQWLMARDLKWDNSTAVPDSLPQDHAAGRAQKDALSRNHKGLCG
jgi:hypothetical protein